MPSQRPDPRRSPHPYAVNARLSTLQYTAIVALAEHLDAPMSTALRHIIDRYVMETFDEPTRRAFEQGSITSVTPDPTWVEKHAKPRPPV